ncbi:hypothetical protein DL764_002220 [Monosporascus ibericus]|uniref:Uncharacterized protein n=1 Tax=Monosporascus ibericus TaxID=155417 RepID=A0A4Q4TNN0_9PEZI|nr:hypothetical protein DL764_002220 [Monosporascus ibericus]
MSDLDNRAPKGGGGGGGGHGGGGHGGKGGGIVPGATYSGGGGDDDGDKGGLHLPVWAIFLIFAVCLFAIVFVAVFWSIWGQEPKRARISKTNPLFRLWRALCAAFYIASGLFIVIGVALDCLDGCLDKWTEWRRKKVIEKMRAPTLRPDEASTKDRAKHEEGRSDGAGGSVLAAARGAGAGACVGGAGAGAGADAGAGCGGVCSDGSGNGSGAPLPATKREGITRPPPTAARGAAKPER